MNRTFFFVNPLLIGLLGSQPTQAQSLPTVTEVNLQPLKAQVNRLIQAKEYLGEPFAETTKLALGQALGQEDESKAVVSVQQILDKQCLADIQINPESRVKVNAGPAKRILVEQGWRNHLQKFEMKPVLRLPCRQTARTHLPCRIDQEQIQIAGWG